jgi:transposase
LECSALLAVLAADVAIPDAAKSIFAEMGEHITTLEARLTKLDQQLLERHKANPVSRLLAAIPGVGPITAIAMAVTINAGDFESGRHFAAWLGLTPREHSTGGKPRLGKITKAGNGRLRQLLVVGATAVIRVAKPGSKLGSAWLIQLLERKPRKVAAVALASIMASESIRMVLSAMPIVPRGSNTSSRQEARARQVGSAKYLARMAALRCTKPRKTKHVLFQK